MPTAVSTVSHRKARGRKSDGHIAHVPLSRLATCAPCLRFQMVNCGKVHQMVLSLGEVLFIGRASRGAIVIDDASVSSQHVELSLAVTKDANASGRLVLKARDKAQNGTGLMSPGSAGKASDVRRLSKNHPEEVRDGSVVVVPLRRKGGQGKIVIDDASLFSVWIHDKPPSLGLPTTIQGPPSDDSADPILEAAAANLVFHRAVPQTPGNPDKNVDVQAMAQAQIQQEEKPTPVPARPTTPSMDIKGLGLPDIWDTVTNTGRWHFTKKLGEGGLGVVYLATDCAGGLGDVAIKVLKHHERANWGKQHAYSMHRESQWSLRQLHNERHPRYNREAANLFARYLEDHTGFEKMGPDGFDAKRKLYEAPDFDWETQGPALPSKPFVVMEVAQGPALHVAIERDVRRHPPKLGDLPPLSIAEKRSVLLQCARALEYLSLFGLIHRDFRGCNMHLSGRDDTGVCQLKVLDLGVMIADEDGQQWNTNQAVQAFRRRGETEEKRKLYDWLPWEVRAGADGSGLAVNFSSPPHSFDVFSLGVLILHLLLGRTAGRGALDTFRVSGKMAASEALGIDPLLVKAMLGDPLNRPHPSVVVQHLQGPSIPPVLDRCVPRTPQISRSRSHSHRSRSRTRTSAAPSSHDTRTPGNPGQPLEDVDQSTDSEECFEDAVRTAAAALRQRVESKCYESLQSWPAMSDSEMSQEWLITYSLPV